MKKNKKIIVVVFVMLLTVSIALAYFVGRTLLDGKGASTTVTTANIHGATLKVEGELNFNAEGMLPGHRDISRIKVTATGNNELIPYNLVWTGNNTLVTNLKFTVYKTSSQIETSSNCKKHDEQVSGGRKLYETCEIKNANQMGEVLTTGIIQSSEESIHVELAQDEFINATPDGQIVYYYIIIEYPNENSDQYPQDKGGSFNGVINAEASDTKPDINIIAAYIENEETGKYEKTDDIPQSGYTINPDMSICNNNAIPGYDLENKRIYFEKLTKSGTECELYFDKKYTAEDTLADLVLKPMEVEIGNITGPACDSDSKCGDTTTRRMNQNGLYETEDDDGASYVFRGTVDNNWVKFGKDSDNQDIWWRIIRINGDGTIRLIYAEEEDNFGETGNGTSAITSVAYNLQYNDNTYVGYYYGTIGGNEFNDTHSNKEHSNIATINEEWFTKTNLNDQIQLKHIDENAGFCNNRQISKTAKEWWKYEDELYRGTGQVTTVYKGFYNASTNSKDWRNNVNYVDLKCSSDQEDYENNIDYKRDYFTWKGKATRGNKKLVYPVGLITLDEVILAGGFGGKANSGYWLYTGQHYWTMTPYDFSSSHANVFYVHEKGTIYSSSYVASAWSVRPVINLKADTPFEESNGNGDWGTINNPYVVKVD